MAAESADPGDGAEDRQRTDILELPIGGPSLFLDGVEHLSREELIESVGVLTERYRAMAERLPAIVYIDDVDDISSNIYTSPQTLEILGISPSEWATDPGVWIDMLHSDDRERVIEEHRASNASGRDFVTEYRLIGADGRIVWIRDHAILIRDVHGTPMYWLVEAGIVNPRRYVQIGLRGYWPGEKEFRWQEERGITSFFMHDVGRDGIEEIVGRTLAIVGDGPVYLTVDVDVLDPAFAPGTGTPEPGGMTSSDLLWACRTVAAELELVGAEVVEVIPTAVGSADVTALVADRIVREILNGIALRRRASG